MKYHYNLSGNVAARAVSAIVAPEIVGQPVKEIAAPGALATFSVTVSDARGVSFQWKFGDVDVPGATTDSLVLTDISAADEGRYSVVVTNAAGSLRSAPAPLLVDADAAATAAGEPLPQGLVALWRGEGDASDLIGGHHGSYFRDSLEIEPSLPATGRVHGALSFDGTVHVRVSDSAALRPVHFAAEAWVFPIVLSNSPQTIIARGSSTGARAGWSLGIVNATPRFWSHRDADLLQAPSPIPLDHWTHLAISFDGTAKRMYVDGVQIGSLGVSSPLIYDTATVPLTIGSDWVADGSIGCFHGRLDEVSLYDRALNPGEVARIFNADFAGRDLTQLYYTSPSYLPPPDLVAWWRGEPAPGNVVPDQIGGHDGGFFHGSTVASPAYTSGVIGDAFAFDGTLHVVVPHAADLDPDELTLEAWVFSTFLSNDPQTIVARGSSTSDAWHLDLLKGKPQFWSWSQSGAQVLEAPTAIALDQWTHLAMSFDGASKRLYVNGEQVGLQDGVSGLIYDVTVPLTIGSGWIGGASSTHFNGRVDEVSLYSRALWSAEVFRLANAGRVGRSTLGPYITSPSRLPVAIAGQAYAYAFTSVRGTEPVVYSLLTGDELPTGLALTPMGVLSGLPTSGGRFSFSVRVDDASGLTSEQLCVLDVFERVPVPSGVVAWWRAEGDAQDTVATNHGALHNGVVFAAGKVGQAFSLDGSDDYVEIADAPALRPALVTLEAWIALNVDSPGLREFPLIVKPVGTGTSSSYRLWIFSMNLRGAVGDAAGSHEVLSSSLPVSVPGRWYHVAYTFDDGTKQQMLYLNGAQVANGIVTGSIAYDAQPLLLGSDREGKQRSFLEGCLDEAAIDDRALTGAEIASIYNAGPAGKRPT